MKIINPYSFIILAVGIVVILAAFVISKGTQTTGIFLALGAVVIGLIVSFMLLSPGTSAVKESGQVASAIGAGSPILLEFQSPY